MSATSKLRSATRRHRGFRAVRVSVGRLLEEHSEGACVISVFSVVGVVDLVLTKFVGSEHGVSVVTMDPTLALVGFSLLVVAGAAHLLVVAQTGSFGPGARGAYVVGGLVASAMLAHTAAEHASLLAVPVCFAVGALLTSAARLVAMSLIEDGEAAAHAEPAGEPPEVAAPPSVDAALQDAEVAGSSGTHEAMEVLTEPEPAEPALVLIDWGGCSEEEETDIGQGSATSGGDRRRRRLAAAAAAVLLVMGLVVGSVAVNSSRPASRSLVIRIVTAASTTTTAPARIGGPDGGPPPDLAACSSHLWGSGADTDVATMKMFQAADFGRFDCPEGDADRSDNLGFQWELGHQRGILFDYVHHRVAAIPAALEVAVRSRQHGAFEPQQLLGDEWFEWFEHVTCGALDLWVALDRKEEPLIKAAFIRAIPEAGDPPPFSLLEGTRWTWWFAEARDRGLRTPGELNPRVVEGDIHTLEMLFDGETEQFRANPPDGTLYPTLDALRMVCS